MKEETDPGWEERVRTEACSRSPSLSRRDDETTTLTRARSVVLHPKDRVGAALTVLVLRCLHCAQ